MNRARRYRGRLSLIVMPFILSSLGCVPYCQFGGGESGSSVTTRGEDGVFVKAEASAGGTAAKIVLERETRKVQGAGEVTYVVPKSLTSQELRLEVGNAGKDATLQLGTHDAASAFDEYALDVAPDGKTVAYKLGAQPWRFVYVLGPDIVVHGPRESETLDWGTTPSLADDFLSVFDAQSLRLDGLYSFEKKGRMLKWLHAHAGEKAVVQALFDLVPRGDHQWLTHAESLTNDGQSQLRAMLRTAVEKGAADPSYYSRALDVAAVEPTSLPAAAVRRATHALMDDESTLANDGVDLAEFLRVHASYDRKDAARIGCDLLGARSEGAPNGLPYAMDLGRPLQLIALAVLAMNKSRCPAVESMADARCTACNGECSDGTLADVVSTTLIKPLEIPETGATPEDPSALAKLTAAAQASSMTNPPSCR